MENVHKDAVHKTSWREMESERINDLITRQMIHGQSGTVGRLVLKKGGVVPRHSHVAEQYSLILSGALRFVFDDHEVLVRAGEILFIPSNAPHSAIAVEDTEDVDFFAPRREDWIRNEDSYFDRQGVTTGNGGQEKR